MAGTFTVAEKELGDLFGSKRFIFLFGLVLLLSSLSAYQGTGYIRQNIDSGFVSLFSGSSSVFSFIHIMVFFGPILGLSFGFDAINKERASGTLSMLRGQPIFRDSVVNGKLVAGVAALSVLVVGTIGIMSGLAILMLGFGPNVVEIARILVFTLLTILYLVFWLSLGILYSVLMKRTSTSIIASIATWLTFSLLITILASVVAVVLVPMSGGGYGSQGARDAREARDRLTYSFLRLSPSNLYEETAFQVLGEFGGFMMYMSPMRRQDLLRSPTLGEALMNNWANISTIVVGLIICFTVSYMLFLRSEIRPGE